MHTHHDLALRLPRWLASFALAHGGTANAFDYFEHRWIGDIACAVFTQNQADCVLWSDAPGGVGDLTFGDLTALVGDHYGTPRELAAALAEMTRQHGPRRACVDPGSATLAKLCTVLHYRELELAFVRSWFSNGSSHNLSGDLEACGVLSPWLGSSVASTRPSKRAHQACRGELDDAALWLGPAPPVRVAGDCFAPPEPLIARLRNLPDRIALATGDEIHFGSSALVQWRANHQAAKAARASGNEVESLAYEAFAVHFLTDLFAAGHIRNPRGSAFHNLADAMNYHDQDNMMGLLVETAEHTPKRWFAFGDRCLLGTPARANRAMVVRAAVASLTDLWRPGATPWAFVPPRLSADDTTPLPALSRPAPLALSLYSGVGMLAGGASSAPAGLELVLSHDWQLTTWWNPLLDLRHGVSLWADGTLAIELASAPLLELLTLPALPFVALHSSASADALRRFGKGIEPRAQLRFGPATLQLDADLGLALVRRRPDQPFHLHALLRAGLFLEVPDRWRVFVPRVTALLGIDGSDEPAPLLMTFTSGIEHTF